MMLDSNTKKVHQIKELTTDKMLEILENPNASVQELTLVVRWLKDNDIKIQVDEDVFAKSNTKKHVELPQDLDENGFDA